MPLIALGKLTLGICISGAFWSPRRSWFYIMCFGDFGPVNQNQFAVSLVGGSSSSALADSRWLCGDAAATRPRPLLGEAAAAGGSCIASYRRADGAAHLRCVPRSP